MDWSRKSRNYRLMAVGTAAVILFSPSLWAYGYQYMREHRARENRAAQSVYLSEDRQAPHPYEEIGPIEKQAGNRESCVKKLRRQAWRDEVDGVVELKYSAETNSDTITCQGIRVRWKIPETRPGTEDVQDNF